MTLSDIKNIKDVIIDTTSRMSKGLKQWCTDNFMPKDASLDGYLKRSDFDEISDEDIDDLFKEE